MFLGRVFRALLVAVILLVIGYSPSYAEDCLLGEQSNGFRQQRVKYNSEYI